MTCGGTRSAGSSSAPTRGSREAKGSSTSTRSLQPDPAEEVVAHLRGLQRVRAGVVALDDVLVGARGAGRAEDPREVDHARARVGERRRVVDVPHVLDVELPDAVADLGEQADG